jgi:acetyl esterase
VTEEMAKTEDRQIAGPGGSLKIRIYTPRTPEQGPLPGLVYFHGGGWFFGSIEAVDRAVRLIANEAKVMVISADYRLAPEHKFPSAQDDAYAIFRWAQANADKLGMDPARIGIGGDSAGGQMSVVTSLRLRDRHEPMPAFMLLYYPAVDRDQNYRSWQLFGEGYGLDRSFSQGVLAIYYKDADLNSQDVSPLRAASLAGLPPAIIATAGFDPLRDSGHAFAGKLMAQGVPVIYKNYSSLMHGFMQQSGTVDDAELACNETARWFGERLRSVAVAK